MMNNNSRFPFCRDLVALWLSFKDPESSALQKISIVAAALYLLNPFDLMYDFLPFFGLLDDIGIIALVIAWLRGKVQPRHWQEADRICRSRLNS